MKKVHTWVKKEHVKPKRIPTKEFAEKLKYPVKALVSYKKSGTEKQKTIASKKDLIELSKKAYITIYTGKGNNIRVNTVMGDNVLSCKKLHDNMIL